MKKLPARMIGELIIYYLKQKESSCKLLNMSFLVLKIQLSLLQYMARDEPLTARSSRNYPQMKEIIPQKKRYIAHTERENVPKKWFLLFYLYFPQV